MEKSLVAYKVVAKNRESVFPLLIKRLIHNANKHEVDYLINKTRRLVKTYNKGSVLKKSKYAFTGIICFRRRRDAKDWMQLNLNDKGCKIIEVKGYGPEINPKVIGFSFRKWKDFIEGNYGNRTFSFGDDAVAFDKVKVLT